MTDSSRPKRRLFSVLRILAGAAATLSALFATNAHADDGEASSLRVQSETGRSVALEVSAQTFEPADGDGPRVTLVGVVHIGDRIYYRDVQELLEPYDLVLYESVKPAGTGGAASIGDDATDGERIERTRAALGFVASVIELHHDRLDRYPENLQAVRDFAKAEGPRLAEFLEAALVDAWGHLFVYSLDAASALASEPASESDGSDRHETGFRLSSHGADGRKGGEGVAADITLDASAEIESLVPSGDDNIQLQLARALSLQFQLNALDYDRENWQCSDMSIDELQKEMAAHGADFTLVEGTLAGTSLPAKIAKFLLGLVRVADAFVEGAISDTLKVLLIEMLSDESLIESSLGQLDPGFAEVIIGGRNQVVVDDMKRLIAGDDPPKSVAILYGAGHMTDLSRRMEEQLDYRHVDTQWLRAIEVDLTTSVVSEADVRRLRSMIKHSMQQMNQMQRMNGK